MYTYEDAVIWPVTEPVYLLESHHPPHDPWPTVGIWVSRTEKRRACQEGMIPVTTSLTGGY